MFVCFLRCFGPPLHSLPRLLLPLLHACTTVEPLRRSSHTSPFMMRFQRASVLFLLSKCMAVGAADQASCVPLSGIVTGGQSADNTLDLDEIKVSMGVEMFHLSNPVVPAVAACSTGWVNNPRIPGSAYSYRSNAGSPDL